MRRLLALLALCALPVLAEEKPQLELIDEIRPEQKGEKAIDGKSPFAAPRPREKDAKACDNARTNFQIACGSAFKPRFNRNCTEAEIFVRENCSP
jgi:hypothetical protein